MVKNKNKLINVIADKFNLIKGTEKMVGDLSTKERRVG